MNNNYLIIGNDGYIAETEANKIKGKFLSPSEISLNYSAYSPDNINGIMDSLGTAPFLSEKRVVLIAEAQGLSSESIDTILSYLGNPLETSVLVISCADSFKKNKRYRELSNLMEIVKADKPSPLTIKNWIRGFFKKEGIEISPQAVDLIVELKGTETVEIKSELEKLASFSGGDRIEAGHVDQLLGRSVMETVFKLVDAIDARDADWTFNILNDLYDQKKQPHEIIGYLSWFIRIMQKIAFLTQEGSDAKNISKELGYSPAYTRRLVNQSKKYPTSRIGQWLNLLLGADLDIKTGRKQAPLALEMLLANLLSNPTHHSLHITHH